MIRQEDSDYLSYTAEEEIWTMDAKFGELNLEEHNNEKSYCEKMNRTPLAAGLADYDENFTKYWHKVFAEYKKPEAGDRMWLAGPSSYVFSLAGEKFAVDLQIRRRKDFESVLPTMVEELSDLSFMLITHEHDDHMCAPLMRTLKDTDIRFYIPHDCRRELVEATGVKEENIVWVKPGDTWQIGVLTFRAFHTPHVKPGSGIMAERGYEIIAPTGKIIIPGDIRDYDYHEYPDFGKVDLCISHLWAGNDALEPENYMPLLQDFVRVSAGFGAKRYFLCHLYEIGRTEKYMWHYGHAGLAAGMFYKIAPECAVEVPRLGHSYSLSFID